MSEESTDVIYKIQTIEKRMEKIEDKLVTQSETAIGIQADLRAIRVEFTDLKSDVLQAVKEQTDRTWALIDRGGKILLLLITVIVLFSGLKMYPDLLKALVH